MSFKEILEYNFLNISDFHLNLWNILMVIVIFTIAKVILWILGRIIRRFFSKRQVDTGRQFAFQQFLKYIIYTLTVILALEAIGIQLSVLWGGAAALMVGIGLGLQQTFNDMISGLILLVEGTVEVEDIVEVDGIVGRVTSIGLRTSKIQTRDRITILVPNSKIVGENATNWTHNRHAIRHQVNVGVAYSSDVELVTKLLLEVCKDHEKVLADPAPQIQFKDFGSSSLDFILHFFSHEQMGIEIVKSDLRYRITQVFRANKIEIPFPQRDLWLRNGVVLEEKK
ncbi:MAG: mechanosensitive ion channel domain-containing protein [Bacteroidota bacterium]